MKTYILTIFPLLFLLLMINSCEKEKTELNYTIDDVFVNAGQNKNLRCLIVYKDNRIIKEKYFIGDSLTPHDVRSVTKSVMATLIGIAIDNGYVSSEDTIIGNYLRPYFSSIDSIKANITLRNLLTMSSGISGNELIDITAYTNWAKAPNQITYTLTRPMESIPGQTFAYNPGAAHLVSAILTQATGMSTYQFAKQNLFQVLGIEDHYWATDKQGITDGTAGLTLTPYDMLKIGQLYLNKGFYNEIQVVSEEWIHRTSTFKITTNGIEQFGSGYGYFWWIGNTNKHDYFFANGYGGQFIVIVPDIKLIVIATNTWSGVTNAIANDQWYSTLDMIINKIIPIY
jgi:CubicO group peptidase (beta-lactamase class C family)